MGEGAGGGQRVPTLSTGRAGARQRIVHMSTACVCLGGLGFALGGMRRLPGADAALRGPPQVEAPVLRKLVDLSLSYEEVGPRGGHPGGPGAGAASVRYGACRRRVRYTRTLAFG